MRIAGVNIGKVVAVTRTADAAIVEVEVKPALPPLREDATVIARPRPLEEGAYFLDVQPGSQSQPPLPDGGRIPATQTRY